LKLKALPKFCRLAVALTNYLQETRGLASKSELPEGFPFQRGVPFPVVPPPGVPIRQARNHPIIQPDALTGLTPENWDLYYHQRWVNTPRVGRPRLDDGHAPPEILPDPWAQARALGDPVPAVIDDPELQLPDHDDVVARDDEDEATEEVEAEDGARDVDERADLLDQATRELLM
jgi:hypothetical protein